MGFRFKVLGLQGFRFRGVGGLGMGIRVSRAGMPLRFRV